MKTKSKTNKYLFYKKTSTRVLISLIFLTLFLGIGYAQIANINLAIEGSATAMHQEGVYISNISYSTSSEDVDPTKSSIDLSIGTILESTIELGDSSSSYITYNITIYNSTNDDYVFVSADAGEKWYDNNNIIYNANGIKKYDILTSRSSKQFTLIFKYDEGVDPTNANVSNKLGSYINFRFRRAYSITYTGTLDNSTNIYPQAYPIYEQSDTDSRVLTISFGNSAPSTLTITGTNNVTYTLNTDYTYNDGTLTFTNGISSDIVINGASGSGGTVQDNTHTEYDPSLIQNGTTVVFNEVEGKPTVTKDENGNITEFVYTEGETVTISDSAGVVDTGFVPFTSGKNWELYLDAEYSSANNKPQGGVLLDVRKGGTSGKLLQVSYTKTTSTSTIVPQLYVNSSSGRNLTMSGNNINLKITYENGILKVWTSNSLRYSATQAFDLDGLTLRLGYTVNAAGDPLRVANATITRFEVREIE